MSKSVWIFVTIVILLAITPLHWADAQSSIFISKDSIEAYYPYGLFFNLSASSATEIEKVKLLYRTNGVTCQSSSAQHTMDITPATFVDVEWSWDFTQSGVLPPGAEIYWQWQIIGADGYVLLTDEQTFKVADDRHDWQKLTSGHVTVQWYQGSTSFGQGLLRLATQSLDRMASNAGVSPSGQIWLTIYPTAEEIRQVDISISEWAGGVAYPEYNSSIMAIAEQELDWANQIIPHELAHLVTDALTFNCLGMRLPTWLGEGLAVYAEGYTSQADHDLVINALNKNSLPPLRSLERGFSSNSGAAGLSYAQSGMVVTYLLSQYGSQLMSDLLASVQAGNRTDKALTMVYNKDTDGIDAEWRISLGYAPQPTLVPTSSSHTIVPTLALWTSSVKPSPSSTPPVTPASTIAPPTSTPLPAASPTPQDPHPAGNPADPLHNTAIISVYIVGFALVSAIFVVIVAIVLFIITRRRRSNP
jgi:hypothetical protein